MPEFSAHLDLQILNLLPATAEELSSRFQTMDISTERANKIIQQLMEQEFIKIDEDRIVVTEKGQEYMNKQMEEMKKEIAEAKEEILQPAGGFINPIQLVYEPLEPNQYVWRFKDKKDISEVKMAAKGEFPYIEIKNKKFWFEGTPLGEKDLIFRMPDKDFVTDWANGLTKSKTTVVLYEEVKKYFKVFLDLPEEVYYDFLALTVFASWLQEIMNSVWFVALTGEFGGGKTAIGEALSFICRHGFQTANPSVAFCGRIMYEKCKMTPFLDEFDSTAGIKDSDLYGLVRTAQRKGSTYARSDEHGNPETFRVFGLTIFAVHGEIEQALLTRTIPIFTEESNIPDIALINMVKENIGKRLYNDLFIWYLDNIHKFSIVEIVDTVDIYNNTQDIDSIRDAIAKRLRVLLKPHQLAILSQLKGRSAELAFLLYQVINNLGLDVKIERIFEIRQEHLEELREIDVTGALRDFLVKCYEERKNDMNYRDSVGQFMISNKELKTEFNRYLTNIGQPGMPPAQFMGVLRDLGFGRESRKNMKIFTQDEIIEASEKGIEPKKNARLCNIYTPRVQKRIGISIPLVESKQSNLKEIGKDEVS